ncbi:MAG: protein kinase [Acidobacteriota bacterium]
MIKNFSYYSLVRGIGSGGMGEVYLAEDSRLGRKVAIKILPADFTHDEDRVRRFAQEARSASALNHPNIITIHDIGEVDGQHYIATEFVEGDTLRQILARGPVPLADALEIALQIASALGAAHTAGIVHRDIKPENVMRRPDGYVKILDFGLAKLTEPDVDPDSSTRPLLETAPGIVMGTIAYMSPEQARGLRLDGRTDLFSMGVVLYEMVTGRRPFAGDTASDMLVSILDREPPSLGHFLESVPSELEGIVARLLAKDAEGRYQNASEVITDLKRIKARVDSGAQTSYLAPREELSAAAFDAPTAAMTAAKLMPDVYATSIRRPADPTDETRAAGTGGDLGPPSTRGRRQWLVGFIGLVVLFAGGVFAYRQFGVDDRIDSLAVLPFANETADKGSDYLCDGITEGLINSLSQLPELSVISRSSVFRLKGKEADVQSVGRDLGVKSVLFGRVKREGDELVINAELVDARTRRQIWGERFRHKAADLMTVQEEMISSIANRLRLRLSDDTKKTLATRPTNNPEAYQLYLRGRYYWNVGSPQALKQADEYFEKAAALDPKYSLALAGCASCHAFGSDYLEPPSESMPKAKQVALAALKQDENIADAHLVLARVSWMFDRDYPTAERKFRRAIELDADEPHAYEQYAQFLALMGRGNEALAAIDSARTLDPASAQIKQTTGMIYYYQHRYDEALDAFKQAIGLDPNLAASHEWAGIVYEQKAMKLEAIEEYLRARRIAVDRPDYLGELKGAYVKGGWQGFWRRELEFLQTRAVSSYVPATQLAEAYIRLDDSRQTLVWLGRAVEERDGKVVAVKVDPAYEKLHGDPRFQELVRRVIP